MRVINKHKVVRGKWQRWSPIARSVFNQLYSTARRGNVVVPSAVSATVCEIIAWNAAWLAANYVDDAIKEQNDV